MVSGTSTRLCEAAFRRCVFIVGRLSQHPRRSFVSTYSPYGPSQLSPWHTAMFAAQQPVNNNMRIVEGCVTTEIPCLCRAHNSNAGNKTVGVTTQAVVLEAETDTIRSWRKIWFHSLCLDPTQSPLALETRKQTGVLLVGPQLQLQPMSPEVSWCPSSYAGSDFCCNQSQTIILKHISQSLGALKSQLKGCWVSPFLNEKMKWYPATTAQWRTLTICVIIGGRYETPLTIESHFSIKGQMRGIPEEMRKRMCSVSSFVLSCMFDIVSLQVCAVSG